jgi:hypothetical protein
VKAGTTSRPRAATVASGASPACAAATAGNAPQQDASRTTVARRHAVAARGNADLVCSRHPSCDRRLTDTAYLPARCLLRRRRL